MKTSIIIPTYKKIKFLNLALAAFRYQTVNKNMFEVIIVDDSVECEAKEIVEFWKKYFSISYYSTSKCQKSGRSSARNIGIQHAKNDILIFIDDDMIVSPDFIKEHINLHRQNKNSVVIGYRYRIMMNTYDLRTYVNPINLYYYFESINNLPYMYDEREIIYKNFGDDINNLPCPWITLYSNNFSLTKRSMLKVGLFSEDFQKKWGVEDVELGYRLWKNGERFILSRKAVGYHQNHKVYWNKNINSLQDNLNLFFMKHQNFDVELYIHYLKTDIRRFVPELKIALSRNLTSPSQYNKLTFNEYEFISKNSFGKKLLIGLNKKMIDLINPDTVFDKNNLPIIVGKNFTLKNLIGIRTLYKNNYFNTVIISPFFLKNLTSTFIPLLFNESYRIGKRIIYIDTKESFTNYFLKSKFHKISLTEVVINYFSVLGIKSSQLKITINDELIYLIIDKNIPVNRDPKLSITIDLNKNDEWTYNGIEFGIALSKLNIPLRFVNMGGILTFNLIEDITKNIKTNSKMWGCFGEKIRPLLSTTHCPFASDFYEIPFSMQTSTTGKVITRLTHNHLGPIPAHQIDHLNTDYEIIWCSSKLIKLNFIKNGGNPDKIFIVPLGVNTNEFKPICPKQTDTIKFLLLGTPFNFSSIDLVIKAFCEVFDKNNAISLDILFLPLENSKFNNDFYSESSTTKGQINTNQYKTIYMKKISSYKRYFDNFPFLKKQVYFGFQTNDVFDRIKYFNNCNCFINLQKTDFTGVKTMQAMSCATPVITMDSFLPDNLCNESNSFIVKSKITSAINDDSTPGSEFLMWAEPDYKDLIRILKGISNESSLLSQKSIIARNHIIKNWTWEKSAEKAISSIIKYNRNKPLKARNSSYENYIDLTEMINKGLLNSSDTKE